MTQKKIKINLKKEIEECKVCRAYHEVFKMSFCELVKKINPNVNKNTCKALLDDLFLEKKITKEELAKRLGISIAVSYTHLTLPTN